MLTVFRRALLLLPLLLPLLQPAHAQRAGAAPPTTDPFGRPDAVPVPVGSYQSHRYEGGMLSISSTDGGTLRVRPWAEGVVRVEYFPAGTPVQDIPSISVVQAAGFPQAEKTGAPQNLPDRLEWQPYQTVGTGHHAIVVQKNPLRVSYLRGTDTLVAEASGSFQRLTNEASGPGGTGVSFRLAPDEHLYGTGSRALPLDRRGRRLTLYNEAHYGYQNGEPTLNVSLPTVLSSRGYMLFFDHLHAGYLDLGATRNNVLEYGNEDALNLGYFLITGDSYPDILRRYTALTGRQPLPPRWGLGLIQSRFGYKSDQEMEQVAARMRRADFPLDALVLDLYWFGGTTRQGDLSWDYSQFRQPVRMMHRLDSGGVKTLLISEPYVMRTSRNDAEVRAQHYVGTHPDGAPYTVESFWAGPATILDMDKPETRDWLWSYYRRRKLEGAAGWWSDLGEPENHPPDMRHVTGGTRAVHNGFGQAWAGVLQENYQREFPEERLFNLARSGWAGMQRNSVFPWSGDVNRSWAGFQVQVPIILGMGQGGVGYMHSDAGGFCVGPTDPELYTRWLQMASLGPILRPHGEGVPPEPYWWPEPYRSIVRRYTHLRYELLPYLYSLAWENSQTGTPLARPMNFDDLRTAALANVNDQYLLGPNLLVAPVLQPGQRRRNVVLPAGNWVDFDSHQTYAGSQTVAVAAPLGRLPLLVRAGAFLPMTPYVPTTTRYHADSLRVRYYADPAAGRTSFTLYDDDGKSGVVALTQAYQLLTFSGTTTHTQADIRIVPSGNGYAGAPAWRNVELLLPRVAAAPSAVVINNETVPATEWQYDAAAGTLRLQFLLESQPVTVSVRGLRLRTAPTAAPAEPVLLEAPDNRTFSNAVQLRYTLHQAGQPGPLRIVNARGQLVRTLTPAPEAGPHTLLWNADDAQNRPVPGGVYWAELAGQRQRLVLVR